jgi:hypothetical protein
MKKFNMAELKPVSTPMSTTMTLDPDENGEVVHAFKVPHALHIGRSFNESLGISNTHSNLGYGIPLLHRLILLAFLMLILQIVELIEKALMVQVTFLDLLSFVGPLTNKLLLHNLLQRLNM